MDFRKIVVSYDDILKKPVEITEQSIRFAQQPSVR